MDPKTSSTIKSVGGSCRIDTFRVEMTFTNRLPELADPNSVEPQSRASFQEFYYFARQHEEAHRSIWITCAQEAEALVTNTVAKSCPLAEAKGLKVVNG
jgi:predicted secreted Zn-dependent protease